MYNTPWQYYYSTFFASGCKTSHKKHGHEAFLNPLQTCLKFIIALVRGDLNIRSVIFWNGEKSLFWSFFMSEKIYNSVFLVKISVKNAFFCKRDGKEIKILYLISHRNRKIYFVFSLLLSLDSTLFYIPITNNFYVIPM